MHLHSADYAFQGRQIYCLSSCEGRTVRLTWTGKYEEIHHPFFKALFECHFVVQFIDAISEYATAVSVAVAVTSSLTCTGGFSDFSFDLVGVISLLFIARRAQRLAFVGYLISQQASGTLSCKVRGRHNRSVRLTRPRDIQATNTFLRRRLGLLTRCSVGVCK